MIRRVHVTVQHAEGEGVGRRGSDIFLCGGDIWAKFCVLAGMITSDGKHFFSNTDPLCIAPAQVCVCLGGGGGKAKLGFFFWGHFRIFGGIATI